MKRVSLRHGYRSAGRTIAVVLVSALFANPVFPQTKPAQRPSKTQNVAPFLPFFKAFNPRLEEFEFGDNKTIDGAWSAVVIRATSSRDTISQVQRDIHQLLMQEAFGVFLIRYDDPNLVFAVDVLPSQRFLDYEVHIIEADARHLVISKGGGDYGLDDGRTRYFYDLEGRKLLGKVSYYGMSVSSIVEFEGDLYFVGSGDRETTVITRLKRDAANPTRDYQIIDRIGGQPVPSIDTARRDGNALVLTNETRKFLLSRGEWSVEANPNPVEYRFNPPTGALPDLPDTGFWVPLYKVRQNLLQVNGGGNPPRKLLIWNADISSNSSGQEIASGIYDLIGKERHAYLIPPTTKVSFQRYRPGWIKTRGGQFPGQYDQNIGPFQLVGDLLWFGITFYDGEGTSGIGGVGYFDTRTNQFHIDHYAEIADWSASALLVEDEDLWVGLVRQPEGSPMPGGLARIARRSGKVTKFDVSAIVRRVVRWNHSIYMGTSEGIFVLSGDRLVHLSFEPDLNGRYSLVMK